MEAPIWKISYRLVLGASPGNSAPAKPYLQGWALVENTSDEDWNGIRLSLVSGRPVSFIQDLYQPLYMPRPEVGPDIVASPYPQTHDENLLAERDRRVTKERAEAGVVLQQPEVEREQPVASRMSSDALNTKVDLDLDSYDLYYGFKRLFANIKSNYTIDESLKGHTVTVHFRQLPFRVALETMLRASNLPITYKIENNIYSIVPK